MSPYSGPRYHFVGIPYVLDGFALSQPFPQYRLSFPLNGQALGTVENLTVKSVLGSRQARQNTFSRDKINAQLMFR